MTGARRTAFAFATGWIRMRGTARAGLALDLAGVLITLVCSVGPPWVFAGRGG